VHVLRRMVEAVAPGGHVLDLQVVRPNPMVEADGRDVCEIDGSPLFLTADAATAAVDALVEAGRLLEQAVDDHDVRKHYDDGADLVHGFSDKRRSLPEAELPALRTLGPCAVRERCRLRLLQVT
jgi:hypothetical protein